MFGAPISPGLIVGEGLLFIGGAYDFGGGVFAVAVAYSADFLSAVLKAFADEPRIG